MVLHRALKPEIEINKIFLQNTGDKTINSLKK